MTDAVVASGTCGGNAGSRTSCQRTPADRRPVENTPASWLDWLTVRSAHMVQPRMLSHH